MFAIINPNRYYLNEAGDIMNINSMKLEIPWDYLFLKIAVTS
jgi:hypothetical protein